MGADPDEWRGSFTAVGREEWVAIGRYDGETRIDEAVQGEILLASAAARITSRLGQGA